MINKRNIHLLISTLIVIPIAIIYGFQPNLVFEIQLNSVDEATVFKAIMFLYLAFAFLWIVGILKPNYWKAATLSNCTFMLGLGFGRIFSIFCDGFPSAIFIVGIFGELFLGFYGWFQLKNARKSV
jgi:hypothetical protein